MAHDCTDTVLVFGRCHMTANKPEEIMVPQEAFYQGSSLAVTTSHC